MSASWYDMIWYVQNSVYAVCPPVVSVSSICLQNRRLHFQERSPRTAFLGPYVFSDNATYRIRGLAKMDDNQSVSINVNQFYLFNIKNNCDAFHWKVNVAEVIVIC